MPHREFIFIIIKGMAQYNVFVVKGQNPGSDQIFQLVQKNDFIKSFLQPIHIKSADEARYHKITGFPAIREVGANPNIQKNTKYGREAIDLMNAIIKKNRPITGGSIDGTDYIAVGADDEVTFDASKIRDVGDFVIPSGPVGKGDIDQELARLQADRDHFDSEFDAKRSRH
jgi:hypothetical protein